MISLNANPYPEYEFVSNEKQEQPSDQHAEYVEINRDHMNSTHESIFDHTLVRKHSERIHQGGTTASQQTDDTLLSFFKAPD